MGTYIELNIIKPNCLFNGGKQVGDDSREDKVRDQHLSIGPEDPYR